MRLLTAVLLFPVVAAAQFTIGSRSFTVAAPAGGTFTMRYTTPASNTGGSGTTNAISLSGTPIIVGDLIAYECVTSPSGNSAVITGVSNGGTYIRVNTTFSAAQSGGQMSGGYIIAAAAETGTDTVTFSGTVSGSWCQIWEYSYTGTPQLDGSNGFGQQSSSTTVTVPTFTPSSTSNTDIYLEMAFTPYTAASSISSPFTLIAGANEAWAYENNTTTAYGPTWTWGSAQTNVVTQQMEFGFNVQSYSNLMLQTFSGTSGAAVTTSGMNASSYGAHSCVWNQTGSGTFNYLTAASAPMSGSTGRLNDGGTYSDSSTTGMELVGNGSSGNTYWDCGILNGYISSSTITAAMNFSTNIPFTATVDIDLLTVRASTNDFVNAMLSYNGSTIGIQEECGGTGNHGFFGISDNTTYHVEVSFSPSGSGTHYVYLYSGWSSPSSPGTLLTTISCSALGFMPSDVTFGNVNTATVPTSDWVYYDTGLISWDGQNPL